MDIVERFTRFIRHADWDTMFGDLDMRTWYDKSKTHRYSFADGRWVKLGVGKKYEVGWIKTDELMSKKR